MATNRQNARLGGKSGSSGSMSTPVRNTPIPKPQVSAGMSAGRREVTQDMIARRAYEIWQSGRGGSAQDHWYQAERELRGSSR